MSQEESRTETPNHMFEAEDVLLNCGIQLHGYNLITISGELTITTERLFFTPNTVERLLWSKKQAHVEITLAHLSSIKIVGLRRRLELKTKDDTWLFAGSNVPEIYGALKAIEDCIHVKIPLNQLVHTQWNVRMFQGAVAYPGRLIITVRRISFEATGLFDAIAGFRETTHIPLVNIDQIQIRRLGLERCLEILCGGQVYQFQVSNIEDRYDELMRIYQNNLKHLAFTQRGRKATRLEAPEKDILELFSFWQSYLGDTTTEDIRLFISALHVDNKNGTHRGWLSIVAEYLIWFQGTKEALFKDPIIIPLWEFERAELQDRVNSAEIRGVWNGETLRFLPLAAEEGVTLFWNAYIKTLGIELNHRANAFWGLGGVNEDNRRATFRAKMLPNAIQMLHEPPDEEEDEPLPFELDASFGAPPKFLECILFDLSMGGCGLVSLSNVASSEELTLSIYNTDKSLSLSGKVVYSLAVERDSYHIGIKFDELSPQKNELLRDIWMDLQRQMMIQVRPE